ncbi:cupin domain-containing protein [Dyadobacter sp. 676]|uniref:Cupin domain-containing protein n=1 Tax=Dyadobacter sp. 676 TaxID=3088362 RepID=A0AAU8FIG0_9BACT
MEHFSHITDAIQMASEHQNGYFNTLLNTVNDHVVRLSVMTEPFYWHFHPNSDEVFLTLEGILLIELESETIELSPGQLFTVQRNIPHRTAPKNGRSVNLTFEHQHMETVRM